MDAIVPLIVLFVLAIPIALIVGLVALVSKVNRTVRQVDSLSRRLAQLEADVFRSRQGPASTAAAPEAARREEPGRSEVSSEVLEAAGPTVRPPELSPLIPAAVPSLARSIAAPPLLAQTEEPALSAPESGSPLSSVSSPVDVPRRALAINWEQFMGVKLFAWIGGFALFLGVAFFVKYSFERNLIPPEVRVAIGFLVGLALLVGGVVMKRRDLAVTSQTLCATGVVILYAVTFACRSVYHFSFFGPFPTFLLMVLITATAFALAVRMEALVVAILGLVGGFLTPILLSTGEDNPVGLFTYIALLDAGLVAVAFRRRWQFLVLMGAVGTVLMQIGWVEKFFSAEKVFVAMAVFLGFDLLFLLAFALSERRKQASAWVHAAAIGLPFVTFGFAFYLLSFADLAARPALFFAFVLGADLCLLALTLLQPALHQAHLAAGATSFVILAIWTGNALTPALLNWALGLCLLFASLHTLFPVALTRLRPEARRVWWGHLFPPVALLFMLIPLFKPEPVSFLVWPAVLLVDALAIGLAVLTASMVSILLVLLLTVILTAVWVLKLPTDIIGLPPLLGVTGGFALFFFAAGLYASRRIFKKIEQGTQPGFTVDRDLAALFGSKLSSPQLLAQIPAISAILPFLLLIMISTRMALSNPSPIFGLAMLLVVLLLGLALASELDILVPISAACVLALEYVWHHDHFQRESAWVPLLWYLAFYAVYSLFPFCFRRRVAERILPWSVSALAGPLHFFLIYRTVSLGFTNGYLGLLPAALAVPMLLALAFVARNVPASSPMRLNLLAWFGGSALFFITLIFPIQFERQWITIGWGLEGLALIWLFLRLPHPGLRATGVVLLTVAFARLAVNPAVLEYHRSSDTRVFNWYLYAYGIVTVCLMFGARLLAPPRHLVWKQNAPVWLYTLGTILAFLLVNIEIADYFAEGPTLTFQFSGNFARDMTYSMAWALFALGLLIIGIWKRIAPVRYAAMGLMVVTLLKLFFHDLSQLGQLYRIGAFMVVAVILILASFLYQRFVSFEPKSESPKP